MDGILCIDKPENMTSFDVVKKVRWLTKAKVGHSGTLDPMATGVLVLALNKATKALPYLGVSDKTYHTKLKLGLKTHTGDIWGDILETSDVHELPLDLIKETLSSMLGDMTQRVPKVSAKKIDGKRSYQYVLDNQEVKELTTAITIHSIEFISYQDDEIEFVAKVSNGTYIRTLCEDIADKLGTIGTMSYLRRTEVGPFKLENCLKLEDIDMNVSVLPTKKGIELPVIFDESYSEDIKNGRRLKLDTDHDKVLLDAGEYFAVYERERDTVFKSVRGLW
ncbi:tRNA pseudouridine(55) synthase TruB [Erysipelothrix sp. HDW6A]|uniref:tRNA pseudouridine(55) synthase TruB n=1 Tax=Erysipelothrix sp. HDW6A TaxID=2714928 RepID=UPI0014088B11|nr:tRNA pseudouridine(55) synthase TruB [Erysipelothrix sp. HDW6A]QIK57501.1 tRNA pseudouridine(55) synthase TruB [Erysipelothrix sp. HDW6A]